MTIALAPYLSPERKDADMFDALVVDCPSTAAHTRGVCADRVNREGWK